jgi:hypothetical protein
MGGKNILMENKLWKLSVSKAIERDGKFSGAFWWEMCFRFDVSPPDAETANNVISDAFHLAEILVTEYDTLTGTGIMVCLDKSFDPGVYPLPAGPHGAHDCQFYQVDGTDVGLGAFCGICGRNLDKPKNKIHIKW